MVRKLLKYEFKYYFRILIFVLPIVLGVGVLGRFIQFFHFKINDPYYIFESLYMIAYTTSSTMVTVTCGVGSMFVLILGVIRFYRSLYSRGGYLTFTLPISNGKILFAKLFSFLICILISDAVCTLSYGIFVFTSAEAFDLYRLILESIFANNSFGDILMGIVHNLRPIINCYFFYQEFRVISLLLNIFTILVLYTCLSVGQLVNKGRIILSIGLYYGYSQIVSAAAYVLFYGLYIFLIVFALTLPDFVLAVFTFIANNIYVLTHTVLISIILVVGGLAVLLYFINLLIMNKKLNLE